MPEDEATEGNEPTSAGGEVDEPMADAGEDVPSGGPSQPAEAPAAPDQPGPDGPDGPDGLDGPDGPDGAREETKEEAQDDREEAVEPAGQAVDGPDHPEDQREAEEVPAGDAGQDREDGWEDGDHDEGESREPREDRAEHEEDRGDGGEKGENGERHEASAGGEHKEHGEDGRKDGQDGEAGEATEASQGQAPEASQEKRYVECEEDAPEETRELVPPGTFSSSWSLATLNVMVTAEGRVLVPLTDAGLGQLLCGAKATAGLKRGRYLFEVKVLEIRSSGEGRRRPKQLVALGFATRSAPLFLGDGDQSIGFDTDGCFIVNGRKSWIDGINDRITVDRQLVLGVVLNLLPDSPNSNTLSLFVNGVRMGKPQALPEELKDKTLYPTMNFKNVTLHANFSTQPFAPLVFACRTLQEAAKEDVEVLPAWAEKHEVIFPVGLPNEGTCLYLDQFQKEKQASAQFTELSLESLKNWAHLSGLSSRELDRSAQQMLESVAQLSPQHFILKQLQRNLLPSARQRSLKLFDTQRFKRTAVVMLGQPPEEVRGEVRKTLRKERQEKAAAEVKRAKRPSKWDNCEKNAASAEDLEAEVLKAMEAVEVTEEEERRFLERMVEDQNERDLAKSFADFKIPSKEEGFQDIVFAWQGEEGSAEYLKRWIADKKLVERVPDLRPNEWFREKLRQWQQTLSRWKRKQEDWSDPSARRKPKPVGPVRSEGQPENSDEVDPWKLLDVTDIGTGEPLFSKFTWEDWQLLELRVQLHLLVHGYKHAMQDPERVTFHESHTEFYYEIFYRRPIGLRNFGAGKLSDLLEMVKDTLEIFPKTSVLDPQLSDDTPFENFLRLVEDARRCRLVRLDGGDETARLRLTRAHGRPAPPRQRQEFRGDDRKGDRGKGDWGDRGKGDRGKGRGYDREPVRHGGRPQHSTRWEHSAPPRGSREHSASGNDGRSSRAMPPPAPPRTEFAARGRYPEELERASRGRTTRAPGDAPRDAGPRGGYERSRSGRRDPRTEVRMERPDRGGYQDAHRRPDPPPPPSHPPPRAPDASYGPRRGR